MNRGGNDDGGVPVFGGKAGGCRLVFFLIGGKVGVVFDYGILTEGSKDLAEDGGVLLNNGGKRNDVDDAVLTVSNGVT